MKCKLLAIAGGFGFDVLAGSGFDVFQANVRASVRGAIGPTLNEIF
jgi:hypothetical protein